MIVVAVYSAFNWWVLSLFLLIYTTFVTPALILCLEEKVMNSYLQ